MMNPNRLTNQVLITRNMMATRVVWIICTSKPTEGRVSWWAAKAERMSFSEGEMNDVVYFSERERLTMCLLLSPIYHL